MQQITIDAKRRQHLAVVFGLEQILAFVFDSVSFQYLDVLFLEAHAAMVIFLVLDVLLHNIDLRLTHRECAITLLPFEDRCPFLLLFEPV